MKVAALAGGVGGAKLLVGLEAALGPNLTAIVNTGDDDRLYGVRVCPDLDIVTYWLAGIADEPRGWGIAGDSFTVVDSLEALGAAAWFRLGDRDLATCIHRTERMAGGAALSSVADEIRRAFGISPQVIPMTDDEVRTRIVSRSGENLAFQDYFVRRRADVDVARVDFAGVEDAKPAPGVIDAIGAADRVIVCPSNPVVSIAPILALPGVQDALAAHPSVVAVTPIVRGAPLKGPADRLLKGLGIEVSASGVARLYSGWCDTFVIDVSDSPQAGQTKAAGIEAAVLDTIMSDRAASARLAESLLAL
ncbi:MAG: 2-phospho-L-lactate transferase [Actinobacteria bacterium]|nr:2-phospho-L-lactate transferase [Actinomycetota bacterium]